MTGVGAHAQATEHRGRYSEQAVDSSLLEAKLRVSIQGSSGKDVLHMGVSFQMYFP